MTKSVLLALVLSLGLGLQAGTAIAQNVGGFGALADQADEPVRVDADTFEIFEENRLAVFTGNVIIVQGDFHMWAPRAEVRYGEGGTTDLKTVDAEGGVKIEMNGQTATSKRASFAVKDRVLTLLDDVKVVDDDSTVTGPRLVIDIRAGTSRFAGDGSGGRVTGIFGGG